MFLGELNKIIAVSRRRVASVTETGSEKLNGTEILNRLEIVILGAPNETVSLSFLPPSATRAVFRGKSQGNTGTVAVVTAKFPDCGGVGDRTGNGQDAEKDAEKDDEKDVDCRLTVVCSVDAAGNETCGEVKTGHVRGRRGMNELLNGMNE